MVDVAFKKVRNLKREETLKKVFREDSKRITVVVPFDKRMGNVSNILRHRWNCLVARDSSALDYLPQPPRLGYSRTASLRDILVRAKLPPNRKREMSTEVLKSVTGELTVQCAVTLRTLQFTCVIIQSRSTRSSCP